MKRIVEFECKICNGIDSKIPHEKRTTTFIDLNYPGYKLDEVQCQFCGEYLKLVKPKKATRLSGF